VTSDVKLKDALLELNGLSGLTKGWDGYRGEPFSEKKIAIARRLVEKFAETFATLDILNIGPCSDGTIQVEFDFGDTVGVFDVEDRSITLSTDIGGVERKREVYFSEDWETETSKWLRTVGGSR
jgi:hypothetical protein